MDGEGSPAPPEGVARSAADMAATAGSETAAAAGFETAATAGSETAATAGSETTAPGAQDRARSHTLMRRLIVLGLFGVLLCGWLIMAMLLPTCVQRAAEQHPPFASTARPQAADCGLLAADSSCPPEPAAVREQPFSLPSTHPERGLDTLHGTLTLPADIDTPRPGVLLIHGSGPIARDGDTQGGLVLHHEPLKLYRALAEALASAGLVVLRYDKRSCIACYPGFKPDEKTFRFRHFEDDAHDALAALAKHPQVRPSALIVVGHSQGGHVAAFVAHARQDVAAVVTLGGQLDGMGPSLLGQLDALAALRLAQLDALGWLNLQLARHQFVGCFDKLSGNDFAPDEVCLGGGVTQQALKEHETQAAKTRERLVSLPMPLLMLQGNLDRNISPTDFTAMRTRLPNSAQIQLLDRVGHAFVHTNDKDAPQLAPAAKKAILSFLASVPVPP